jgi:3-isopropylmalate/(R)-2-methylmalate dehydratase small subunit
MNTENKIISSVIPLVKDNIDTDQIIPARFLKIIDKSGLGDHLFADWRYNSQGEPITEFILNRPGSGQSRILLAGENFGCGSSREHAAWALKSFGLEVIIARSFGDIFRNNSMKNGLLLIELSDKDHEILMETVQEIEGMLVRVDIIREILFLPTGTEINFTLDPFAKRSYLEGIDEMDYLLDNLSSIETYERNQINKR